MILATLLETGLDPQRLEVEITEGVLFEDFERALFILRRIKGFDAFPRRDPASTLGSGPRACFAGKRSRSSAPRRASGPAIRSASAHRLFGL
jgi:hypothetical protein